MQDTWTDVFQDLKQNNNQDYYIQKSYPLKSKK
jgi:hypothetical protein